MKLISVKFLTAVAFVALVTLTSCERDNGAVPNRVGIEDVPVVTTNLETGTGNAATITFANQAAFSGKFKISVFFPGAVPPTKIDVAVRKNGVNTTAKVFKADVSTLPASFTVTAADIATLFGAPLALNDTYDFGPNIYVGTKLYDAFPAASNGNGTYPAGMATVGFYEYVRYSVK